MQGGIPSKILTIDIETTGLLPWQDEILMVGVRVGDKYHCFRDKITFNKFMFYLKDCAWLGHNLTFDVLFLLEKGWIAELPKEMHDTQSMAHVIKKKVPKSFLIKYEAERKKRNALLPKGATHRPARELSLKVLAPWFLKVEWFWENPANHDDEVYNAKDCLYTEQLFRFCWAELERDGGLEFYLTKMRDWGRMLMDITYDGINISEERLSQAEKDYANIAASLRGQLDQEWSAAHQAYREKQLVDLKAADQLHYAGLLAVALSKNPKDAEKVRARYAALAQQSAAKHPERVEPMINFNSPVQMKWLLKDYFGLNIEKLDYDEDEDESPDSTGKAVLARLIDEGRKDIQLYLDWRQAEKINTAFLPTYRELMVGGKIHATYKITGTRTGRTSSSKPNFQQIPPKLYTLFRPSDGHTFIKYDLSGIEAALIAVYSNDRLLYDLLSNDISIHDYNAHLLFNLDCKISDVKDAFPKQRKCIKNIGFGCFYGAGWRRIQIVFANAGFVITDRQAKEKRDLLKESYRGVFRFHKDVTEIFEGGGTLYNLLGRPISIQDPADAYMKGFNTLIQSSASDLNLHACYKARQEWLKTQTGARALALIHDCILAESPKDTAKLSDSILVNAMTNYKLTCDHGPINLKVEGGVSDEWT